MDTITSKRQRHLINAYEVKAGMVQFAGKTVWSIPDPASVSPGAAVHSVDVVVPKKQNQRVNNVSIIVIPITVTL